MIYLQLLWVYLKIGTFGFGGGYAMLSTIYGCGGNFADDSGADWN